MRPKKCGKYAALCIIFAAFDIYRISDMLRIFRWDVRQICRISPGTDFQFAYNTYKFSNINNFEYWHHLC